MRGVAGLVLGAVTGVLTLVLAPALLDERAARAGADLERRRIGAFFNAEIPAITIDRRRAAGYLLARAPVGLLGGVILGLCGLGVVTGARLAVGWWITRENLDAIPPSPVIVAYFAVAGAVLAFLAAQGLVGVAAMERRIAARFLGPDPLEVYRRRVEELAASRAEVVAAVDDERRRIERDLHDGVQQRLVALGMLIGRARRADDPDRARDLLEQAHDASRLALADLRETSWRVFPSALDSEGLGAALEAVAERAPLPVDLDVRLDGPDRPPREVETAAYFVVCEAVTNAAKHSGATRVSVRVARHGRILSVTIIDDGTGGADPSGGGLRGLARRAEALDGTVTVLSPPGGPTEITAELPCG
ncbi:sensor histidine kinase [Actinomadura rupiterrae]|uniref:sensor histidine kinase n=1 Tax=Actinomadura rupiterrae TaxID=559627 RepID=UPI0020A272E5|nr:sensor histidine kinase [Actinomadura rupiterrae]MCP2339525.1 signal transduction histidine kinase [Actinomadura rupiterrae]